MPHGPDGLHRLDQAAPPPPGYSAPTELTHEDIRARALSRADLHDDVRGIGDYTKLYAAPQHWLADVFPFENPHYSNREIPEP